MPRVTLSRLISAVFIALAIVAAATALIKGGNDLFQQPLSLNLFLIALSFVIVCCGLLIAIAVWRRVLGCYEVRQSLRNDVRAYCYGALGVAIPGSIWSIVGRSALYARLGASGFRVATASVVESFIIGVAATFVYALASFVQPDLSLWQRPEVALGIAFVTLFFMHPRILNRLVAQTWRLTKRPGVPLSLNIRPVELLVWVGLESIVVIIGGIALFVLLASFRTVPAWVAIRIVGVWAVASATGNLFFWLPGTFVLRDAIFVIALAPIMSLPVAIIFALLARLWSISSLLLLAILVWLALDLPFGIHNYNRTR